MLVSLLVLALSNKIYLFHTLEEFKDTKKGSIPNLFMFSLPFAFAYIVQLNLSRLLTILFITYLTVGYKKIIWGMISIMNCLPDKKKVGLLCDGALIFSTILVQLSSDTFWFWIRGLCLLSWVGLAQSIL